MYKKIKSARVQVFFRKAMFARAMRHGLKVEGEGFVALPLCNGFGFRDGDLRLEEVVKEYRGEFHRTITILFKRKAIWRWKQNILAGKDSLFLSYARLQNFAAGFFLDKQGHDNFFPSKDAGLCYEVVNNNPNGRSTFDEFYCRETLISIPDSTDEASSEMLVLCISSGGDISSSNFA